LQAATQDQPPTAANYPASWKEQAMFLIVLVVIVAVIMIVAVPRMRQKR
jgi:hypothetical protein